MSQKPGFAARVHRQALVAGQPVPVGGLQIPLPGPALVGLALFYLAPEVPHIARGG